VPTPAEQEAIARALRERPLPPTTLIALQNLTDCVRAGQASCRDMVPALLAWLAAAEANPRLNAVGRQQVRINYGQVCLETDRFEQGLTWVQSAYRHAPQAVFRLMEANFLMLMGRFDAAAAALEQVGADPAVGAADRGHLAVLRQAIAQRRQTAAGAGGL